MKKSVFVVFSVPNENLEDFWEWLHEKVRGEDYDKLGVEIRDIVTG